MLFGILIATTISILMFNLSFHGY